MKIFKKILTLCIVANLITMSGCKPVADSTSIIQTGADKIRLLWYNKEKYKELKSMKKITVDENRRCPKCGSIENQIRVGYNSSGTQRCKCKDCNIRYTPEPKKTCIFRRNKTACSEDVLFGSKRTECR